MMNEKYFESAEFYQKRFHNFASLWVVPCFLLLLFVVGFSVFAKKEVTLSSRGTIEATRVIDQIQSTSNSPIQVNHLKENKEIKKGEILVEYQEDQEKQQGMSLTQQLDLLKKQEEQLKLLKTSIETGESQFTGNEHFDYQQQIAILQAQAHQQNATIASQNASASSSQAEIGQVIQDQEKRLADYHSLKSALLEGRSLDATHPLYSFYQSYAQQAHGEENAQAQASFIGQLDSQIQQLEASISNYRIQYAGSGSQQAFSTSLDSQIAYLKAQQLSKVGQDLLLLSQQIADLESKVKTQETLLQKTRILAKDEGVLHLNDETKGASIVAEGTPLAVVYPLIQKI